MWWAGKRSGSADGKMAEVTAGVEEQDDKGCKDLKQGKPLSGRKR